MIARVWITLGLMALATLSLFLLNLHQRRRATAAARADAGVADVRGQRPPGRAALDSPAAEAALSAGPVRRVIVVPGRLVNIVTR
ncbi:MAG: hypothetical protein J7M39_05285 [Anaerolineae bacterium]|nr:hypothetical protein [Anaerolineae bacterium]